MRKRVVEAEGQGSLFEAPDDRRVLAKSKETSDGRWKMPDTSGSTVAEVRVRWLKRLTPGQVTKVEAELLRIPIRLSKLGFGPVEVERSFVRRRKD